MPDNPFLTVIMQNIFATMIVYSVFLQEVEDLFNSPNCPKYTNCEFAHNNSWYVTFDTEEDAQKVLVNFVSYLYLLKL